MLSLVYHQAISVFSATYLRVCGQWSCGMPWRQWRRVWRRRQGGIVRRTPTATRRLVFSATGSTTAAHSDSVSAASSFTDSTIGGVAYDVSRSSFIVTNYCVLILRSRINGINGTRIWNLKDKRWGLHAASSRNEWMAIYVWWKTLYQYLLLAVVVGIIWPPVWLFWDWKCAGK